MAEQSSPSTTVPDDGSDIQLPAPDSDTGQRRGGATSDFSLYYQAAFDDAYAYLKQKPLKQRLDLLEMLRKKGFQSGSAVSPTGLDPTDVSRVRELLLYQDSLSDVSAADVLLNTTLDKVKKWTDTSTSRGSSTRTPDADLDTYLTAAMQQKLGRSPRKSELEKFRKAYGAMEAAGGEPSATTAAMSQVQEGNKDEYEAAQFASFASTFETMLRGA